MTLSENASAAVARLHALASPEVAEGKRRFAAGNGHSLGIRVPALRALAREIGKDHAMAQELWTTRIHEARLLATLVADPAQLTAAQMDAWTAEFDSWDICDGACYNLFRYVPWCREKIDEYAADEREFVRRTAFALIAGLAIGDKKAGDERFLPFFALIEAHAADPRNFVRKAVNWALRQTGKRNARLLVPALELSRKLAASDDKTARWVGSDALRELNKKQKSL